MQQEVSVYHYLFVLYLGYAHLTDRKVTEEEGAEIQKKAAKWFKVDFNNIHVFNKIMMESTNWYNSLKTDEEKYQLLMQVSEGLGKVQDLDLNTRKDILSDLRDIAVTDGRFSDSEKQLHDLIGKNLGINIMTTDDKETNRKLGF
ncbi:MAG: hypothetical protein N4A45_11480 [Flavobacteriales bacterium]|jgi:uncharacterized tellurite resistance protein B-like protein|nr:hypothetical protein [Flavobacteriales bacterium]